MSSTPDQQPLRRYVKGESFKRQLSSENLNQPIEVLDQLRHDYLANQSQKLIGDGTVNNIVLGLITNAGPNGEADDATQSRYWVIPQRPDPSISAGDSLVLLDENIPEASTIFRATNIAEDFSAHTVATDETVYVVLYNVTYDCFPTVTHWFFSRASGSAVDVLNNGTNVVTATPFINIPSSTVGVLNFATATVSGTPGANLQLHSASTRQVLQYNGTVYLFDYVRFH